MTPHEIALLLTEDPNLLLEDDTTNLGAEIGMAMSKFALSHLEGKIPKNMKVDSTFGISRPFGSGNDRGRRRYYSLVVGEIKASAPGARIPTRLRIIIDQNGNFGVSQHGKVSDFSEIDESLLGDVNKSLKQRADIKIKQAKKAEEFLIYVRENLNPGSIDGEPLGADEIARDGLRGIVISRGGQPILDILLNTFRTAQQDPLNTINIYVPHISIIGHGFMNRYGIIRPNIISNAIKGNYNSIDRSLEAVYATNMKMILSAIFNGENVELHSTGPNFDRASGSDRLFISLASPENVEKIFSYGPAYGGTYGVHNGKNTFKIWTQYGAVYFAFSDGKIFAPDGTSYKTARVEEAIEFIRSKLDKLDDMVGNLTEEMSTINQALMNVALKFLTPYFPPGSNFEPKMVIGSNSDLSLGVLTHPGIKKKLIFKLDCKYFARTQEEIGHTNSPQLKISRHGAVENTEKLKEMIDLWSQNKLKSTRRRRQPTDQDEFTDPETDPEARQEVYPASSVIRPTILTDESFFPIVGKVKNRRIPGRQLSKGSSFTIAIHSNKADFPKEIFQAMNLHYVSSDDGFLGWIGGSIDDNVMWINEVQSDLMQRTLELTNQEAYDAKLKKEKQKIISELQKLRSHLRQMSSRAQQSERYRATESINLLQEKLAENEKNKFKKFKLSEYSEYKSRLENTYKRWVPAFYSVAINYAKSLGIDTIYIISSDKVASLWGRGAGEDTSVYKRAYDGAAQSLGATKENPEWWRLDISGNQMEYIIHRIASLISEDLYFN